MLLSMLMLVLVLIKPQMLEFGAAERWPAKYCARKWDELHPGRVPQSHNFLADPWASERCSPVESMMHHSPRPSYGRSPRPSPCHTPRPSIEI